MRDGSVARNVLFLTLGGLVGSGAALLMSPQTGKENREDLGKVLEKLKGPGDIRETRLEPHLFHAVDDITSLVIDILKEEEAFTEAHQQTLIQKITTAKSELERIRQQRSVAEPV